MSFDYIGVRDNGRFSYAQCDENCLDPILTLINGRDCYFGIMTYVWSS